MCRPSSTIAVHWLFTVSYISQFIGTIFELIFFIVTLLVCMTRINKSFNPSCNFLVFIKQHASSENKIKHSVTITTHLRIQNGGSLIATLYLSILISSLVISLWRQLAVSLITNYFSLIFST